MSPDKIAQAYDIFETFLRFDTWCTFGASDEGRFFEALAKVVKNQDFDPENMGDYISQRMHLAPLPRNPAYNKARDRCVAAAHSVRRYLKARGEIE